MFLPARFILIYIWRSPPTHGQYLLTPTHEPTVSIKSMPVLTPLFNFNTQQCLKKSLVSSISVFITGEPLRCFFPQTAQEYTGTFQTNDVSTNTSLLLTLNPYKFDV